MPTIGSGNAASGGLAFRKLFIAGIITMPLPIQ
jgi:hypothetical protein